MKIIFAASLMQLALMLLLLLLALEEDSYQASALQTLLQLPLRQTCSQLLPFSSSSSLLSSSIDPTASSVDKDKLEDSTSLSCRRNVLLAAATVVSTATTTLSFPSLSLAAPQPNGLVLVEAENGLKWADAKVGTGAPLANGSPVAIDFSMASTAGRFPQIYTTKDKGTPYRWVLGDGSTIAGIEQAIVGNQQQGIPPMLPGGIRRVIVPSSLGFEKNIAARPDNSPRKCLEGGKDGAIGPIPPKNTGEGAYQRWVQFYCNPRIPYQPDLVLDIKLYGKRTNQ